MREVDARGLACPQPVLMLREAMGALAAGETLALLATDPLAPVDVEAWCLRTGHALLAQSEREGVYRFVVQRRDAPAA
jgi:tRNA 2-thiouridine synthesizing protein A